VYENKECVHQVGKKRPLLRALFSRVHIEAKGLC